MMSLGFVGLVAYGRRKVSSKVSLRALIARGFLRAGFRCADVATYLDPMVEA
jgi:hypothetical protein